jgi:hypothetical protein
MCSHHLGIEVHQVMSHIAVKYETVAHFSGSGGEY